MAVIYSEDWAAGLSLFTSVNPYNRPTHGTDVNYPHIRGAEGITIRAGMLDYRTAVEDYSIAGVWIKGPGPSNGGGAGVYATSGFWNGDHGHIEALYHPTTDSLDPDNNVYCPLIGLSDPNGTPNVVGVSLDIEGQFLEVQHRTEAWPSGFFEQIDGAPMPVAGQPYHVRISWQCGTYNAGTNTHAADGFLKVWINDELIYHAINISLYVTKLTSPVNMVDGVQFGYFGLLGPLESFGINDSEFVEASASQFRSGVASNPTPWIRLTLRD